MGRFDSLDAVALCGADEVVGGVGVGGGCGEGGSCGGCVGGFL